MRLGKPVLAFAFLAAIVLAVSSLKSSYRPNEEIGPILPLPVTPQTPLPCQTEIIGGSEPGGTLVVFGLLGLIAAVFLAVAVFVFPPSVVAACLTFGPVSLLGLVVLYVHFKAHSEKESGDPFS